MKSLDAVVDINSTYVHFFQQAWLHKSAPMWRLNHYCAKLQIKLVWLLHPLQFLKLAIYARLEQTI